jgi:hypothetical protein
LFQNQRIIVELAVAAIGADQESIRMMRWVVFSNFAFRLEGGRTFFCFAKRK